MTRRIVLLLVLVAGLLLSGCEGEDRQIIIDMALLWARDNAISLAAYSIAGTSGDAEVDAILEARGVIQNINAADDLMEEGRADGDLTKMEQAIELRPEDYTYRVSYGTALLKSGDVSEAKAQFDAAHDSIKDNYGPEQHIEPYSDQGVEELTALEPYFEENGFQSAEQCREYYWQLSYFWYGREKANPGQGYVDQANYYNELMEACK